MQRPISKRHEFRSDPHGVFVKLSNRTTHRNQGHLFANSGLSNECWEDKDVKELDQLKGVSMHGYLHVSIRRRVLTVKTNPRPWSPRQTTDHPSKQPSIPQCVYVEGLILFTFYGQHHGLVDIFLSWKLKSVSSNLSRTGRSAWRSLWNSPCGTYFKLKQRHRAIYLLRPGGLSSQKLQSSEAIVHSLSALGSLHSRTYTWHSVRFRCVSFRPGGKGVPHAHPRLGIFDSLRFCD